jgi:hypothetical protein
MIYSEDGIRRTLRLVVPFIFSILVILPIVLMNHYNNNNTRVIIVICFVLGVSALVAWLTKARDWEIIAITAAYDTLSVLHFDRSNHFDRYCAILVVFLSGSQPAS